MEALITADPEVMGGVPVFAGTRVPVATVLASLNTGLDRERLRERYPGLTDEHIDAAQVYRDVPRPSQPLRAPASWKIKSRRRVSRVSRGHDRTCADPRNRSPELVPSVPAVGRVNAASICLTIRTTRIPRMQGLPPMTFGPRVMRSRCDNWALFSECAISVVTQSLVGLRKMATSSVSPHYGAGGMMNGRPMGIVARVRG